MRKVYPLLNKYIIVALCALSSLLMTKQASAQYFGQNKVRYKNLKFKVYKTPHFEIYYYMKNDSLLKRFAQESELWYTLHQQVFRDTFRRANPIILYADHPDFQQTTAIDGEISVGTGGVTEGLKNRVVMPIMETNQTTRHVIGHELVHAFQYHSLLANDTTNLSNINNLPLWMIEGMAEYLSLGKKDAYTAMWMRDAYLNHDIPTVRDLTQSTKYFPYRYGEAFWSFLGSTYGDTIIVPFFKNTARFGLEYGIRRTFGYDDKTLSNLWKNSIEATYKPYLKDTVQTPVGTRIIDNKNSGEMNVAPSISPDGKYLAFLSEKDLFTVDLYLADAKTGRVLKKLTSKVSNTHIDEFNFIESAGTWSPDGKKFAFSVFSNGRNRMMIVSVPNGRVLSDLAMGNAEQFSNLSWSPNGKDIVFQGLSNGYGDLYMYNLDTKKVRQLTNDKYSDYQPSFSRDGKKIIFSSDRTTYDKSLSQEITFNLAELDLATGKITDIPVFNGANNLNPQYSADGTQVYFLSNRDGFRNMYRYTFATGKVEQMTDLFTGICGITEYSPALSISANDDIVYSYYRSQKYALYNAKASQFKPLTVEEGNTNFDAALLPPPKAVGVDLINANLNNFLAYQRIPADSIHNIPYRPQFKLDYLASSGVGVGVSTYGTGLASGVQGVFSDILGRNQIYAGASVNGEIYDFGAQVAYINQSGRWNFGTALSHIPYQYVNYNFVPSTYNYQGKNIPVYEERYDIVRIFQDQANIFTAYPFSKTTRIEFGTGVSHYSYRVDRYSTYYDTTSRYPITTEKHHISRSQYEADPYNNGINLKPFTLMQFTTALVGDNSYFGIASPLTGFRYRIQAEYDLGTVRYFAPSIDLRRYIRLSPVTFAGRLYTTARIGDTQNLLYPMFIGYPFLIRGYEYNSFYNSNSTPKNGFTVDQLSGNRIAVANFEMRLPFTGPEKLSQIKSKFLFTELNLFFDAGLAWNAGNEIKFQKTPDAIGTQQLIDNTGKPVTGADGKPVTAVVYNTNQRVPALSAGVSLRVNIFGFFVLEPYLAVPFNRNDVKKPVFGLGFTPGW
ncbi:DPP IV N-terminal domain-containing protein [Mucilaginibacter sp. KACC 22063]|uniref:DPP IV N-terminal domain-containing protein n=1 Tax=Mucilaginibacter sp. KACC 22063 TaxID=3025666 RepID=UPI0023656CE2|nr:DPP IV N-terminal domain-containing protein [Mucilaginibacter sp. KACC 22063]WDF53421.1 DPP IV N-terminal domain-containing protein [Mucilaginibacter sp. KACC 22063]